ncbi:DUF6308 family protein [Arthrobacter sp. YN]|uniref:DUF6308 family protein n=1 Tax=Arthrobacter sp. YN TaxID=2020486 RepID=UPI0012FDA25C|nr:DUF6308 family protein [Arthrobacter sp. YN]
MTPNAPLSLTVAGKMYSLDAAMAKFVDYPGKTPLLFDLPGAGEHDQLTLQEVARTRKVSSRISHKEAAYFVDTAQTAPWIKTSADLEHADPRSETGLFTAMAELFEHFRVPAPRGVNFAKISKVLHLKQPGLFPLLDSHIARAYKPSAKQLRSEFPEFGWRRHTWIAVRNDLLDARSSGALDELRNRLIAYESQDPSKQEAVRRLDQLTDLRLLDILVW